MDNQLRTSRYRPSDVEAVIARALELDGGVEDEGLTEGQVRAVAAEMGVSTGALEASLAEHAVGSPPVPANLGGLLGPAGVAATRAVSATPARAAHRLAFELERRGLEREAGDGSSMRWAQRRGWWPDLHRISAVITVAARISDHPDGCLVRLEAGFGPARRAHLRLAAASLAAGLFVASLVSLAMVLPVLAAAWAGGPLLAMVSFRRRTRMIEERLDTLLAGLAS